MPAISFQSISKSYASARASSGPSFLALDDINLDIQEGEFFGLLGPNGAGKTTLISILAGLTRATSGRVAVMGCDVQHDYAQARRKLGIVPQELVFDPFLQCSRGTAISVRILSVFAITMTGSMSC
jgi:ABC-2 type transport system ATP-binding protein